MRAGRTVCVLVVAGITLAPALVRAQPPAEPAAPPATEDDEEARGLFLAGAAAYRRADFETALGHFERAYQLSHRPELLFNIGVAAQRSRHRERALEAMREYLERVPDAANRADVEARIAEVQEALARDRPGDEPAGSSGPGALPWIVLGGSVAVAVTGAVLFTMAQGDIADLEDPAPDTAWVDVESTHDSTPVISGIGLAMLSVGAVGTALGVVLLIGGGDDSSPEVGVAILPGGAVLRGAF